MNFFEHQDRARKKTTRLVVLFVLAVIMILAAVNAAAYGIMRAASPHVSYVRDAEPVFRESRRYPGHLTAVEPIWRQPTGYVIVTGCTLLIILGGSLYKIAALSRGGHALAQQLGGRPISGDLRNPQDQMLQNIVEEMSIASGVPVPGVYVMENERGINAFAAGFSTRDAVIAVTRGTLEQLNRDELQGVVAHEFSHILNGDMRMNLRLIGILHGILVVGLVGYGLLRTLTYVSNGRSSRRNSKENGGQIIILIAVAGAALLVIGYVGVFFGRLIQAAVSRQREFLADASAVQFTRNPAGILGALRKIAGSTDGSRVQNHNALEAAHMFFGSAGGLSFTRLLATHPPIEERIRAIDPMFDGRFAAAAAAPTTPAGAMGFAGARIAIQPDSIVQSAGSMRVGHTVASVPDQVRAAAHEPFGARAVVFALLLSEEESVRQRQLDLVKEHVETECYRETLRLIEPIARLGPQARLPILDLALPALRQMSPRQNLLFEQVVRLLIEADARVTLFEFALARILQQQLDSQQARARPAVRYHAVGAVRQDAALVLSALASASSRNTDSAYSAGARRLEPDHPPAMLRVEDLDSLAAALERLSQASGAVKQRVIEAAAYVVAADGEIEVSEAELLRAVAATLDVPLPPLAAQVSVSA